MRQTFAAAAVVALFAGLYFGCDKLPGFKGREIAPGTGEGSGTRIEGLYVGSGTNPDRNSYDCEVDISRVRDLYKVTWYFNGRPGYEGVGVLRDDAFVVGFAGPEGYGVVVYELGGGGSLNGTWAVKGSSATGTETLVKK